MCEISVHMDKYSHLYTLIDVRFYVFMQLLVIHALIYAFIDYLGNVYASPPPHHSLLWLIYLTSFCMN